MSDCKMKESDLKRKRENKSWRGEEMEEQEDGSDL